MKTLLIAICAAVLSTATPALAQPLVTPTQRQVIALPEAVLARHVGDYEMLGLAYKVLLEKGGLVVVVPELGPDPILPQSETRFFSKAQPVELTFQVDGQGSTTGFILHYMGSDLPAKRLP